MTVGFIGLGKLGMPVAEVMSQHYEVIGYDVEKRSTEEFQVTANLQELVEKSDMIFVAVPTPHSPEYGGEKPINHLPNKDFDYTAVCTVLDQVNSLANKKIPLVLISTVLPGTVREQFLHRCSNLNFIYNPYLIAMGTVKSDFVNPEMVIIGTEKANESPEAQMLIDFYKPMMTNNPRYVVGTWDEGEAIKIFYNTFISAKISLVNMIQDVAQKSGNMNVDVVTKALADSTYRITSAAYMKAGMGDGGPCHPRDNIALRFLSEKLDLGYDLFGSIMHSREVQAKNMAKDLFKYGENICIVGKAYKPQVAFTDGSYSLLVAHYLEEMGAKVCYYDENSGDSIPIDFPEERVYLIGYWDQWTYNVPVTPKSTLCDPWRRWVNPTGVDCKVVHYGNTRLFNNFSRKESSRRNVDESLPLNLK